VVVDSLTEEEKKCPVCGAEMVPIGTEFIRGEAEFIPAKYEVTEYVATTYECPQCKQREDARVGITGMTGRSIEIFTAPSLIERRVGLACAVTKWNIGDSSLKSH